MTLKHSPFEMQQLSYRDAISPEHPLRKIGTKGNF